MKAGQGKNWQYTIISAIKQKYIFLGVISLQYGSNKGATQSGINFGNTRHM
jgi:Calponin family repeat